MAGNARTPTGIISVPGFEYGVLIPGCESFPTRTFQTLLTVWEHSATAPPAPYVVYDPTQEISQQVLHVFALRNGAYHLLSTSDLPLAGLGLVLWHGTYEGKEATWLRWCDAQGELIPTGEERAAREAAARHEVEARLHDETAARQQAEAEVARLREALARLGLQP